MSKIRINDLARELEVPNKQVLDALPKIGVTEKKTHSSSIEGDEAHGNRAVAGEPQVTSPVWSDDRRTGQPTVPVSRWLSEAAGIP